MSTNSDPQQLQYQVYLPDPDALRRLLAELCTSRYPYYKYQPPSSTTTTTMSQLKFVRFKPESAATYSGVPMFNAKCVYCILSENEDDVLIEMHPACGSGHSAKLAIPHTLVDVITTDITTLMPKDSWYAYSEQFLATPADRLSAEQQWPSGWLRDANCRALMMGLSGSFKIHQALVLTIAYNASGQTSNLYMAPHLLVPAADPNAAAVTASAPEDATKPKRKHPKPTDTGKLVTLIRDATSGAHKLGEGEVWYLNSYNRYRGQWSIYDGTTEAQARAVDLELFDDSTAPKTGTLVTQHQRWLDHKHPRRGITGYLCDSAPCVMVVGQLQPYGTTYVHPLNADGSKALTIQCNLDEIRPLTKDEETAYKAFKSGSGRDEQWVRRMVNPSLIRVVDQHPKSPLIHGMIAGFLGIAIDRSIDTSKGIMDAIVAKAASIKAASENSLVLLRHFMPLAAEPAPVAPTPQPALEIPVPVATEAVEWPVADGDEEARL